MRLSVLSKPILPQLVSRYYSHHHCQHLLLQVGPLDIRPPDTVRRVKWDSSEEYECYAFLRNIYKGGPLPRKLTTHDYDRFLKDHDNSLSAQRHRNEYKIRKHMNDFVLSNMAKIAELEALYRERNLNILS